MGDIVCIRNTSSGFLDDYAYLTRSSKTAIHHQAKKEQSTTHQDYSNGDIKAIKMYCFGYVEGQLVHKMQK